MKVFKITENIEAVCEVKSTRNGFKHEATLLLDGVSQDTVKVCYLNRTWESYEFQTVLSKLIEKTSFLTTEQKEVCDKFIQGDHTDWSGFKSVSMVAKIGDILCTDKKEKNDWKARMLKAGLGDKGLSIPDDWDSLDEDTKQKRLDSVIALCGEQI